MVADEARTPRARPFHSAASAKSSTGDASIGGAAREGAPPGAAVEGVAEERATPGTTLAIASSASRGFNHQNRFSSRRMSRKERRTADLHREGERSQVGVEPVVHVADRGVPVRRLAYLVPLARQSLAEGVAERPVQRLARVGHVGVRPRVEQEVAAAGKPIASAGRVSSATSRRARDSGSGEREAPCSAATTGAASPRTGAAAATRTAARNSGSDHAAGVAALRRPPLAAEALQVVGERVGVDDRHHDEPRPRRRARAPARQDRPDRIEQREPADRPRPTVMSDASRNVGPSGLPKS